MNNPIFHTHRTTTYTYTLLNSDDEELYQLDGVTTASITLSASTRLRARGSMSLADLGQEIRWGSDRVRVDIQVSTRFGEYSWPLGVFLLASPKKSYDEAGASWDVELLGKLVVLDEDKVDQTFSVPQGANVVDQVVALIRGAGEERIAATPSTAVTPSMLTWEAGTPKLTVINELLGSINYWALWVDGGGTFRVEPYTRPGERSPAWTFQAGETSIHLPEWDHDQDLASVPNRVVLVGHGSENTPALIGVAINENPKSPFSFQARDRWVTFSESGVEAADQATLDALAARKLIDLSTPTSTLSVSFLPVPLVPNNVAKWQSQGYSAAATIKEIKYTCTPDGLCTAELTEVTI